MFTIDEQKMQLIINAVSMYDTVIFNVMLETCLQSLCR